MTILTFLSDGTLAAKHVLAHTSLSSLPDVALHIAATDPLTIEVSDVWHWSSGEKFVLIPLLASIAQRVDGEVAPFFVSNLATVDPRTAGACVEAITIAAGFGHAVKPMELTV